MLQKVRDKYRLLYLMFNIQYNKLSFLLHLKMVFSFLFVDNNSKSHIDFQLTKS